MLVQVMSRQECIDRRECYTCGGPARDFRSVHDEVDFRSYGMCQICQDGFFEVAGRAFELYGPDTIITVTASHRRDACVRIEAFVTTLDHHDPSEVEEIGWWDALPPDRAMIAQQVKTAVARWCVERRIAWDDVGGSSLRAWADFERFVVNPPKSA